MPHVAILTGTVLELEVLLDGRDEKYWKLVGPLVPMKVATNSVEATFAQMIQRKVEVSKKKRKADKKKNKGAGKGVDKGADKEIKEGPSFLELQQQLLRDSLFENDYQKRLQAELVKMAEEGKKLADVGE